MIQPGGPRAGDPWSTGVESSWNLMAHGDAREGKWRGNWRMEWVASTLHTTSEHDVCSITTADAHTSAASSPRRFKLTRPFRRKTKSGFCVCAITLQLASTTRNFRSLYPSSKHRRKGAAAAVKQNSSILMLRKREVITAMAWRFVIRTLFHLNVLFLVNWLFSVYNLWYEY